MKKTHTQTLLSLVLLLSFLPYGLALAQAGGPALHLEQVDTTAFPSVSIRLNAWDVSGLPLAELSPQDVSLSEDGGAAFHPDQVQVDQEAPLGVALVLDVSGSMIGAPLADAKAAAARFLDRLKSGDRAALVAFSSPVNPDPAVFDPARELAFSTDLVPVYNLVESLTASGNTELYNATAKAVRLTANLPAGHRAVLLLSDGRNEPANVGSPDEAIQLAKDAKIPVFVIGLGDQIDETYLRRLASETGGLYRNAPGSSELARLFSETATLLKTQYRLSYTSQLSADGSLHELKVRLNTSSGSAESSLSFGPLPAAPKITQPAPLTETPIPPIPTTRPATQPAPAATALPLKSEPVQGNILGWPFAAALALIFTVIFVVYKRRAPKPPTPEICEKCGADLTGKVGACPHCGHTKRLPKRK